MTASSGVPDIGLVTLDGFCKTIKEVALSSGLPVLADADTGFGEGEMVAKTVGLLLEWGEWLTYRRSSLSKEMWSPRWKKLRIGLRFRKKSIDSSQCQ